MILYHGSNMSVEQIALSRSGTGLYNQSTGYLVEYLMREIKTGSLVTEQ